MRGNFNPPSRETFEALAQAALDGMPVEFRQQLGDIVTKVEEFATREQLESVGLSDKWELSGLYEGRPLPDQSIWESGTLPPAIYLFRQPLLAEMRQSGVGLEELVRHVVVHEAGHHFGFSDDDMHALEDQADD
ncbi:metallopeptidase family protein [Altererythrobacter arenosus]|uniref:Metallopeptidase family protein n=1 Tax=Altererythrobacter arenosus TaxID=3032592 RepID=A0ABY8FQH0_9SPHN|nr:metallopeptidase family protein [Altererythrobacter sp. CAU 1644]WFL77258.1 metallopeptidase family protein [Altererythrobacter sp. CAU 1644]